MHHYERLIVASRSFRFEELDGRVGLHRWAINAIKLAVDPMAATGVEAFLPHVKEWRLRLSQMPLAEMGRLVAASLELVEYRGLDFAHRGECVVDPVDVVDDLVGAGVDAGPHAGAGRCANRPRRIGPVKADALCGQPVKVRGLNESTSGTAQCIRAMLV